MVHGRKYEGYLLNGIQFGKYCIKDIISVTLDMYIILSKTVLIRMNQYKVSC